MNKLSERKNDILLATIEDYIKDASPITSIGVHDKHLQNVSSATLRAELNALEAMGYLKQLHTSGGRVPTTDGYRYYVESLLGNFKIEPAKLEKVSEVLSERTKSISEIVTELAKIISEATNYPTVIMMNGYNNLIVEEIKIIPLIDDAALILIRTTSGIVNNTIKVKVGQKACDDAGRLLTKQFAGQRIGYMIENISEAENEIVKEVKDYETLVKSLLQGLKRLVEDKSVGIRGTGSVKLLESGEEKTINSTKKVLTILENEEQLEEILQTEKNDVSFDLTDDEDKYGGLAVVKAPLTVGGKNVGTIGVLGPQRMDYSLIASALRFLTNELENIDKLEDKK